MPAISAPLHDLGSFVPGILRVLLLDTQVPSFVPPATTCFTAACRLLRVLLFFSTHCCCLACTLAVHTHPHALPHTAQIDSAVGICAHTPPRGFCAPLPGYISWDLHSAAPHTAQLHLLCMVLVTSHRRFSLHCPGSKMSSADLCTCTTWVGGYHTPDGVHTTHTAYTTPGYAHLGRNAHRTHLPLYGYSSLGRSFVCRLHCRGWDTTISCTLHHLHRSIPGSRSQLHSPPPGLDRFTTARGSSSLACTAAHLCAHHCARTALTALALLSASLSHAPVRFTTPPLDLPRTLISLPAHCTYLHHPALTACVLHRLSRTIYLHTTVSSPLFSCCTAAITTTHAPELILVQVAITPPLHLHTFWFLWMFTFHCLSRWITHTLTPPAHGFLLRVTHTSLSFAFLIYSLSRNHPGIDGERNYSLRCTWITHVTVLRSMFYTSLRISLSRSAAPLCVPGCTAPSHTDYTQLHHRLLHHHFLTAQLKRVTIHPRLFAVTAWDIAHPSHWGATSHHTHACSASWPTLATTATSTAAPHALHTLRFRQTTSLLLHTCPLHLWATCLTCPLPIPAFLREMTYTPRCLHAHLLATRLHCGPRDTHALPDPLYLGLARWTSALFYRPRTRLVYLHCFPSHTHALFARTPFIALTLAIATPGRSRAGFRSVAPGITYRFTAPPAHGTPLRPRTPTAPDIPPLLHCRTG